MGNSMNEPKYFIDVNLNSGGPHISFVELTDSRYSKVYSAMVIGSYNFIYSAATTNNYIY